MYLTLISLLAHWWPWQAPPARTAAATPVPPPRIALQAGLTHVVLLGEGNFSFSLALCRLLWPSGGSSARPAKPQLARSDPDSYSEAGDDDASDEATAQLITDYLQLDLATARQNMQLFCTSFDDELELLDKYPETKHILAQLKRYPNVHVVHSVNAWELSQHFSGEKVSVVAWNHPHLGVEDFRLHRFLMAHFFHSVSEVLHRKGLVCVSLVEGQAERWDITAQADKQGFALADKTHFLPQRWPGYETRRNRTANSFQNTHTQRHTGNAMNSWLYHYRRQGATLPTEALSTSTALGERDALVRAAKRELLDEDNHINMPETPSKAATKTAGRLSPASSEHTCRRCGKAFSSERGLKSHVRQVHELQKFGADWQPQRAPILPCEECGKKFSDAEALWQHKVSKHSADPEIRPMGPLTTSDGALVVDPQTLQSGQSADHNALLQHDTRWVPCDICGQAVPAHWLMGQHLETLKPLLGIRAKCMVCHKSFTEHRALRQHLNFCRLRPEDVPTEILARRRGPASQGQSGR